MTATELHEALQGVPEECLCGTIKYHTVGNAWYGSMGQLLDDHAAALQRDSMTEYLMRREPFIMPLHQDGQWWLGNGGHPTRLHALAAACRYVASATPPPHPARD